MDNENNLTPEEEAEVTAIQDFLRDGIIENPLLFEKDLLTFLKEEEAQRNINQIEL